MAKNSKIGFNTPDTNKLDKDFNVLCKKHKLNKAALITVVPKDEKLIDLTVCVQTEGGKKEKELCRALIKLFSYVRLDNNMIKATADIFLAIEKSIKADESLEEFDKHFNKVEKTIKKNSKKSRKNK